MASAVAGPAWSENDANLLPAIEHLDGALGRGQDDLAAGPDRVRHRLVGLERPLQLAGLDREDAPHRPAARRWPRSPPSSPIEVASGTGMESEASFWKDAISLGVVQPLGTERFLRDLESLGGRVGWLAHSSGRPSLPGRAVLLTFGVSRPRRRRGRRARPRCRWPWRRHWWHWRRCRRRR